MRCKEIRVSNAEELKMFYRLLFVYKSIFFRFTEFKIKNDKYNIKQIIDALNIKNKKQRIIYIYETACRQVDDFYAGKNVCEFKDNRCLSQRLSGSNNINGCCRLCQYRTGGNCPTRNLACKLFFCNNVSEKYKILTFDDILILKCLNKRQRFMLKSDYFSLEKDVVMDLYYGIFIGSFRVTWRFGRTLIKNVLN